MDREDIPVLYNEIEPEITSYADQLDNKLQLVAKQDLGNKASFSIDDGMETMNHKSFDPDRVSENVVNMAVKDTFEESTKDLDVLTDKGADNALAKQAGRDTTNKVAERILDNADSNYELADWDKDDDLGR